MIYQDGVQRDYKLRAEMSGNSESRTLTSRGVETYAYVRLTWGNAFLVGTHGIQAQVRTWINATETTLRYQATLYTPWGTYQTVEAASYPTGPTTLVEIDACYGSNNCDSGQLDFNALRWYVDGSLIQTLGPQSDTILVYDERLNVVRVGAASLLNPDGSPVLPGCADADWANICDVTNSPGGWEYRLSAGPGAWVTPAVTIVVPAMPTIVWDCDTVGEPNAGSCTCDKALPAISASDSYTSATASDAQDQQTTATYHETRHCHDYLGNEVGDPCDFTITVPDADFFRRTSWIDLKPRDGGILKRTERGSIFCGCDDPFLDTDAEVLEVTVTDTITVCQSYQEVKRWRGIRGCCDAPACSCGAIDPEVPPPTPPDSPCTDEYLDSLCVYVASAYVFWPDYTCGGTSYKFLSSDVGFDKTHIIAGIRTADDYVDVWAQDHVLVEVARLAGIVVATSVCIRYFKAAKVQRVFLYTEEAGTIYRRISDTLFSFAAPVSLGAGVKPFACLGPDGKIEYVYRYSGGNILGRRYDANQTALEAEFVAVAGVDNDQGTVTAFPIAGGQDRVVMRVVIGGVLTTKISIGGIVFV